ncbi:hypothetical protein CDAR_485121 [Caerostris darwini]|uniref:Uncharacterized protein n=1 Tax=Caerostris darwini TaxID=1538125 RepID=A0AAV4PEK6_9ARAC|nr:hypothetical protein CDAR_485121 [Caerostris darwini]
MWKCYFCFYNEHLWDECGTISATEQLSHPLANKARVQTSREVEARGLIQQNFVGGAANYSFGLSPDLLSFIVLSFLSCEFSNSNKEKHLSMEFYHPLEAEENQSIVNIDTAQNKEMHCRKGQLKDKHCDIYEIG